MTDELGWTIRATNARRPTSVSVPRSLATTREEALEVARQSLPKHLELEVLEPRSHDSSAWSEVDEVSLSIGVVHVVLSTDTNPSNNSYGEEWLDSVWSDEQLAQARAGELEEARVATYTLDVRDGWCRPTGGDRQPG